MKKLTFNIINAASCLILSLACTSLHAQVELPEVLGDKFIAFEPTCKPTAAKQRPFLGIVTIPNKDQAGLVVTFVGENSPAQIAGMLEGDVFLQMGDKSVDIDNLKAVVSAHKVGDQVSLLIMRAGQKVTLYTHLGAAPDLPVKPHRQLTDDTNSKESRFMSGMAGVQNGKCKEVKNIERPWLGVEIIDSENRQGAVIIDVVKGTSAEKMNLQIGDIIKSINGKSILNADQVVLTIGSMQPNEKIKIAYERNAQKDHVKNRLGKKSVELVNWIDCPSTSPQPSTEAKQLSKNELKLREFSLFPNPNEGNFNLRFAGKAVPTTIEIMDIAGKQVYKEFMQDFNGNYEKPVQLGAVAQGTYLLRLIQGNEAFVQKFIIQ